MLKSRSDNSSAIERMLEPRPGEVAFSIRRYRARFCRALNPNLLTDLLSLSSCA
jgi:hypothetical protein